MLRIQRQRLQVQLDAQQSLELQKHVAGVPWLINGVRGEYFRRLGIDAEEIERWLGREQALLEAPLVAGDVALRDQETVLYFRIPRGEGFLEAGIITRGELADYQDFFNHMRQGVRAVSGIETDWVAGGPDREATATLAGESSQVSPSKKEVEAARELENEQAQRLVGQILQQGSVFFNKMSQAIPANERPAVERQMSRFEDLGVISKDFAVLCRKTGQQILRVSSRAAIEDPSQKTFKCFICGNSVSEESLDEIITVTDFGRKLVERDYWLVVRVLGALESIGIANSDVRVHTGEGDLTNFFVTINDQFYLLVLSNRKFTLEDSYLINAHVAAYSLGHVIVTSTERVSKLMRNHLQASNPNCEFDFMDSLAHLEERFMDVMRQKEKAVLRNVLANFSALTPVHVQDLLLQKISPEPTFFEAPEAAVTPVVRPVAVEAGPREAPPVSNVTIDEDSNFSMMGEVLEAEESLPEESQVGPAT